MKFKIKSKNLISKMWRPNPDTSERSNYYRFERNERTTLFNKEQFNEIMSTITPYDLVAYGELEPFYKKIKKWLGLRRENILLTSGSDMGIKTIYETYISDKDEVIITLPNYAMFSVYAAMFNAKPIDYFYENNLKLNVERLIRKINPQTKMLVISNPSHTGTVLSQQELIKIIQAAAQHKTIVLIDEAYHGFHPDTMVDHINDFSNLIVTRTFSKAFGLASIRIGLLIANESLIKDLYKVKLVHEITGLAAKIGCYFLDNQEIVENYVADVNLAKIILYQRLKKINFKVYNSESNFVFFQVSSKINPESLKSYLETKKVLIRGPFQKYPFDQHLRVTVGNQSQMNLFCDIVEEYLSINT